MKPAPGFIVFKFARYVAHQEVIFGGLGQTLSIRHDSIFSRIFYARRGVCCKSSTIRGIGVRFRKIYWINKEIKPMKKYNIAILGATGAVGQEFLTLIEERKIPFC